MHSLARICTEMQRFCTAPRDSVPAARVADWQSLPFQLELKLGIDSAALSSELAPPMLLRREFPLLAGPRVEPQTPDLFECGAGRLRSRVVQSIDGDLDREQGLLERSHTGAVAID